MDHGTRIEVLRHAIRWTTNIFVELSSNHATYLPPELTEVLRSLVRALDEARAKFDRLSNESETCPVVMTTEDLSCRYSRRSCCILPAGHPGPHDFS